MVGLIPGFASYYFLQLPDQSDYNFRLYIFTSLLMAIVSTNIGLMISTFFDKDTNCFSAVIFFTIIANLGSGNVVNTETNLVSWVLSLFSPHRYCSELLLRRILSEDMSFGLKMTLFGYQAGDEHCL